ncbi:hypothetical protein [Promicromonospora aerolata]|uniref:Secreted protein n=1 Tax=Promicromonospora aerolata TaxID=195749 RepID=A0ABW4V8W8_9MICO
MSLGHLRRRVGGLLCAASLTAAAATGTLTLSAGVAHAADDEGTGVSVTIPEGAPTDDPTDEPTDGPADEPTGPGTGPTSGGGDGRGGSGGSGGSGGASGDAPGTSGPGGSGGPGTGGGGTGGGNGTGAATGSDGGAADATPSGTQKCVPERPPVPAEPATEGDIAALDKDVYLPGHKVTAMADGFGKGEKVQLVLFAEPQVVSTLEADRKGTVEAVFTVSGKTTAGPHTLQLTGWCGDVALAELLVGSAGGDAAATGVPAWAWWAGGGLGVVGVGAGGWYVFRLMRAPGLSAAGAEVAA